MITKRMNRKKKKKIGREKMDIGGGRVEDCASVCHNQSDGSVDWASK